MKHLPVDGDYLIGINERPQYIMMHVRHDHHQKQQVLIQISRDGDLRVGHRIELLRHGKSDIHVNDISRK